MSDLTFLLAAGVAAVWCAFFFARRPSLSLYAFMFLLMALNDYVGGLPTSIVTVAGHKFYGADLLLLFLVAVFVRIMKTGAPALQTYRWVLLALVALTLCGIGDAMIGFASGNPAKDVIGDVRRFCYYPWAVIVPLVLIRDAGTWRRFERVVLGAAAIVCLFATYRIVSGTTYWPAIHAIPSESFRSMSYHDGLVLALASTLFLAKSVQSGEGSWGGKRWTFIVLAMFIASSNYRMTWIALVVAILSVIGLSGAVRPAMRRLVPSIALATAVLASTAFFGIHARDPAVMRVADRFRQRVLQFDWSRQDSFRSSMWHRALVLWKASPWTGRGFGYKFSYLDRTQQGTWFVRNSQDMHNVFLQLLMKGGPLELTAFVGLQLAILVGLAKHIHQEQHPPGAAVIGLAFQVMVLLTAAVQPVFSIPNTTVLVYLVLGTALASALPTRQPIVPVYRYRLLIPLPDSLPGSLRLKRRTFGHL